MARKWISYEMAMMIVGPSGSTSSTTNPTSFAKLDYIQSYGFSFNIERTPLKQIGSSNFAARQTQLAPDIDFNLEYYLNDGWNENYIGLNINRSTYANPFVDIFTTNPDRNFYVLISPDNYSDANADKSTAFNVSPDFNDYNILGIGNTYLSNFEISVAVNELAKVSASFVGANANVQRMNENEFINNYLYSPAIYTTGVGDIVSITPLFAVANIVSGVSRNDRYMSGYQKYFDGGCPYSKCVINATPTLQSGISLGFDFDNFQSMTISIPFERKALYGFGNNYPFSRKIQKPIIGTLNIDSLVDTFYAENLASTFVAEDITISGYNFDIVFGNLTGKGKMGVKIQNAKLDSYSVGLSIGNKSSISTTWSFEVTQSTGILISGSYPTPNIVNQRLIESINKM